MHSDFSSPERLVLFSDGVFAIATTLLALELRLPTQAAGLARLALDRRS